MKILEWIAKRECCGCGACEISCPKHTIQLVQDVSGFRYPKINQEQCINCNICKLVCPVQNNGCGNYPIQGYAAVNRDYVNLQKSASGGAFSAIATSFLKSGGYVCGAEMILGNCVEVRHIIISDINELERLQGSKYVQSNIVNIYKPIESLLKDGEKVLFSGTPCQVAALKAYLRKEYDQLYTIDIICHGVPSPKIFASYIEGIEKKYNGKVVEFKFRDKSYGWGKYGSILLDNGKKIDLPCEKSSYYSMFMSGDLQRENCYSCQYSKPERISDITLGDYWGIEKYQPELLSKNGGLIDIEKGISAILLNTQKSYQLMTNLEMDLYEAKVEYIIAGNSQLRHPVPIGKLRNLIYCIYCVLGYKSLEGLFIMKKVIRKIRSVIRA